MCLNVERSVKGIGVVTFVEGSGGLDTFAPLIAEIRYVLLPLGDLWLLLGTMSPVGNPRLMSSTIFTNNYWRAIYSTEYP